MKFLGLVWGNFRRKKLRTTLTLLSIFVALLMFGLLCALKEAFGGGVSMAGADRLMVRHRISLIMNMPEAYGRKMAQFDGVAAVTPFNWFNGIYQEDAKNFFASFAVDPESLLALYPEILLPAKEKAEWLSTRTGAVVGKDLANRFGWKIGDTVPLTSPIWPKAQNKDGEAWQFKIVGIYTAGKKNVDQSGFYFRYDYFDEARSRDKGTVGWYGVQVKDPARGAEIAAAIDREFANSAYETKAETEAAMAQGFVDQVGNIGAILLAVLSAVFFTILLVAGNTMAQAVRERTAELGVLKALGFTDGLVLTLVLAESLLLAGIGGGLGLGLALVIIAQGSPIPSVLPVFFITERDILIGVLLIVALGLATGLIPALQAMRLRVVDALGEARVIRWLSEIFALTLYNLGTVPQRKGAALAALVGIAGVTAVLVGVLSIAEGFQAAMRPSGAADAAIVLRKGADSEMTSGLSREEASIIADAPGIAKVGGRPAASPELFVLINLPKKSTGTDANVPLRGVGEAAFAVHQSVQIVNGKKFGTGLDEVIAGVGAVRTFAGLDVGDTIHVGQHTWKVVGWFSAGSGASDTEIWADAAMVQSAYNRGDSYQSMAVRLESPGSFDTFKDALTQRTELTVRPVRLADFLADQSTLLTQIIQSIGLSIVGMMALGALFGALNTMYSAVSNRMRELATLRALGFGAGAIVISVMMESAALALAGGAVGAGLAYAAFNGYQASTINWQSFTQVAFQFTVTPMLLLWAIVCSATIGLIGGLLPALRAARMPIAIALREM